MFRLTQSRHRQRSTGVNRSESTIRSAFCCNHNHNSTSILRRLEYSAPWRIALYQHDPRAHAARLVMQCPVIVSDFEEERDCLSDTAGCIRSLIRSNGGWMSRNHPHHIIEYRPLFMSILETLENPTLEIGHRPWTLESFPETISRHSPAMSL